MISPNPINVDGDQIILLTDGSGGTWTSDVGSFYYDAGGSSPYANTFATSIYFKPFNLTATGTVSSGGGTVVANVTGVLPPYPSYPLEWEGQTKGAVVSISRSGRRRGRVLGDGGYTRDFTVVYNNRSAAEVIALEDFHAAHFPHKTFKYRNLWHGIDGYFNFDAPLKGSTSSRAAGKISFAIVGTPFP